ncbi:MAG: hypothetical protein OXE50_15340 [Chloroflexi bacterium]|nr:hypothetical protein [Chloroflexota bacterium]
MAVAAEVKDISEGNRDITLVNSRYRVKKSRFNDDWLIFDTSRRGWAFADEHMPPWCHGPYESKEAAVEAASAMAIA